jgi:hypothetical protein
VAGDLLRLKELDLDQNLLPQTPPEVRTNRAQPRSSATRQTAAAYCNTRSHTSDTTVVRLTTGAAHGATPWGADGGALCQVCTIADELRFYAALARRSMVFSRRARLVLLGDALSGKSSLLRALIASSARHPPSARHTQSAAAAADEAVAASGPAEAWPDSEKSAALACEELTQRPPEIGARRDPPEIGAWMAPGGGASSYQTRAYTAHATALVVGRSDEPVELSVWDVGGDATYACVVQPVLAGASGALLLLAVDGTQAHDAACSTRIEAHHPLSLLTCAHHLCSPIMLW